MNNISKLLLLAIIAVAALAACDDDDSYADRRKRERSQISSFLSKGAVVKDKEGGVVLLNVPGNIKVISEEEFYANDSTTNVDANEYVLFKGSGVYMQIVRKGTGAPLAEGKSASIICRYFEYNIAADTLQSTNNIMAYEATPDVMNCTNTYGLFTASFSSGQMKTRYKTASVPSGWLVPLRFIGLGRPSQPDEEIALVRLILPSMEGQSDALTNVYPCFYEISYQKGR